MPADSISLTVPEGTPLPIVLDKEVPRRKVGQPIRGKIAEPAYPFDKLVVPAGSQVTGKVIAIARVSVQKCTLAALDANFSPYREMQVRDAVGPLSGSPFPPRTDCPRVKAASGRRVLGDCTPYKAEA